MESQPLNPEFRMLTKINIFMFKWLIVLDTLKINHRSYDILRNSAF